MTTFKLRFQLTEIPRWAGRYDNPAESAVEAFAHDARTRGYLTHAELIALGEWKSPRVRSRIAANDPDFVEAATRAAFATPNERLRIEILTLLRGVAWPMASSILHWCHPDRYPILDTRALWSLDSDPPRYDFPFWQAYTHYCREQADQAGVSMREFDRALWQYSKEKQR